MAEKENRPKIRVILFSILFSNFFTFSLNNLNFFSHKTYASSPSQASIGRISFPLGVFEDANILGGNETFFRTIIDDLKNHGLDTIMFANNFSQRDSTLLQASDEMGFNVYMSPAGDLNETWWSTDIPTRRDKALEAARNIIAYWKTHPSLKGYIVKDEPGLHEINKVQLMNQAFRELDPARPAMPILIGVDRVGPIFEKAQPNVMLIDVYPFGAQNPPCDLTMTGFGYQNYDFVSYIRTVTQNKPPSTPLWMILQTHNFLNQLREPSRTEVREQHWLAIGEGVKGIFWFIYSSQQGWTGLVDNPPLYDEVSSLVKRTDALRSVLAGLQKVEDQFSVTGNRRQSHYISTLRSSDNRTYIVVVNKDCQNAQKLIIKPLIPGSQLKDLETSTLYRLGSPILFPPGDGKIFELVTNYSEKYFYIPIIGH
jgi:hypothetical protein